jgi:hypothetical protein
LQEFKKKWIRQVLQDLRGEKFDERTTQEKGTALTMSRKEQHTGLLNISGL